jgi:hypothetical protein
MENLPLVFQAFRGSRMLARSRPALLASHGFNGGWSFGMKKSCHRTQARRGQCRCRQGIDYVVADRTLVYAKSERSTIVRECPVRMRIENWSGLGF